MPPSKLPSSDEEWAKANTFFKDHLISSVMNQPSPEDMNRVLSEGIYAYLTSMYGTRKGKRKLATTKHQVKHKQHDRALKKVTELRNIARKKFREAKRNGLPVEEIQSLGCAFFDLVRQHSLLKRKSSKHSQQNLSRRVRDQCHRHFWQFVRDLLDNDEASQISPQFGEDEALRYFQSVYQSTPKSFETPQWMPPSKPPPEEFEFDTEPISMEEIERAIKNSRSSSSPSPLDQIPYVIFKKCPALSLALHSLFNGCWSSSTIPTCWKTATIKLLGKSSAKDDPTSPANFRPIALTSCIGKLFTTIMKNRWLEFMTSNEYLDSNIQKAFMTAVPGCTEHHSKLAAVLSDARSKHKSLAICWLDLANAYGSVHHSLIQFALRHYHAPQKFQSIVASLYSNLSASIKTNEWATSCIPLEIGVYQGDPLSVVIFNTVMNTMVDTLKLQTDLGYVLDTNHSINLLQYADDTCVIAESTAACQCLLDTVDRWLAWSGMRAKVSKCHSLALQGSTGSPIDPGVHISGQHIPFIGEKTIKFLGLPIQIPHCLAKDRSAISEKLSNMLQAIDSCSVSRQQKLLLYRAAVCPRLTWLLTITDLPLSWVNNELHSTATRYLKKWAGLAKSANPSLLYLPTNKGGLNLPSLSTLFKRLQVSRQCQLLMSKDPTVRKIAEDGLRAELTAKRKMFRPAVVVRDIMKEDSSRGRKALAAAAKSKVQEEDEVSMLQDLQQLPKQGHMSRISSPESASVWVSVVTKLPQETMKFTLNAMVDTLPHNANLYLWKKKPTDICPLCSKGRQTLLHVLNNCSRALDLRRYNERHDAVLSIISESVREHLPSTASIYDS